MASSKIPAIGAALETLFDGATGLEDVNVSRISPDPLTPQEWIVVGPGKGTRTFRSLGNQPTPLDEDFSFACEAACIQQGKPAFSAVGDRAWELLELAETALRGDIHLGDLIRHALIGSAEESYQVVDKGRQCTVRFVISGKARIT